MIGRLFARVFAAWLVAFAIGLAPARAQSYPNRPIKLIVAVLPGGPMDVMGRLIAQHLSSTIGQQVVVENRAGAGTTLGAKAVASADPDGYTLLLGNAATLAIGPTLYKNAGYDPLTSFAPVAFLSSVPYVMIASPSLPGRTPPELVAYAKANPGKLSFGVPNAAPHLLAAWFKAITGTDVVIVPYKGASAVLTDMLGGQIQAGFETTSVLFGHLHEKKIKALATATTARLPDLPDVPTMIESGYPDFVANSWTSIMAPAGTPKDIVAKLNREINTGLVSAPMQARFKQLAAQARPGTPEDLAAFVASELPKWQAMAKLAGVSGE